MLPAIDHARFNVKSQAVRNATGRSFARKIAAAGVDCILVARREVPLAALAEEIRNQSGTQCITASIDLSAPDAFDQIATAVGPPESPR